MCMLWRHTLTINFIYLSFPTFCPWFNCTVLPKAKLFAKMLSQTNKNGRIKCLFFFFYKVMHKNVWIGTIPITQSLLNSTPWTYFISKCHTKTKQPCSVVLKGLLTPIQHESYTQRSSIILSAIKYICPFWQRGREKRRQGIAWLYYTFPRIDGIYSREILFSETENRYFLMSSN